MTLNGVMAVTWRYFTEFGKLALQKTIYGGIYARVYCIFSACTMSSYRKFTLAISSPDEFLVQSTVATRVNDGRIFNDFFIVNSLLSVMVKEFLPRCMECRRGLAMRFLSVRPSVCQTRAL